ncbi:MAG TPA: trypsin-like peptidase domain-containing protein, partial [Nitrosospira sp.]|nr:trypsin-like peptidase domain-containing protein [Nitrosospira sp.]
MIAKFLFAAFLAVSTAVSAQLPDFTELVEKQGAAVVNISTVQGPQGSAGGRNFPGIPNMPNIPEDDPFFDFFRRHMPPPGSPRDFEARSMGSGFIISSDGYILTNTHLVDSVDEINVKLTDKREFRAKLIGADRKTDIALLKIDAAGLPKVTQGDPNKLKVGEWVVA